MPEILAGKIAIVTGGTWHWPRHTAERLLAEGATVAICGVSPTSVEKATTELTTHGRRFLAEVADPR
jgi:NAD(P)-dependent dehydrogenase (short-subunit alcohol dehydrogenase family)